jgi:hypothetical protein
MGELHKSSTLKSIDLPAAEAAYWAERAFIK